MFGFGYSIAYLSSFKAISVETQQCKETSGDLCIKN